MNENCYIYLFEVGRKCTESQRFDFVVLNLFQGFDEYMNLVLDDAEEVHIKKKSRKSLGGSQYTNSYVFLFPYLFTICFCFTVINCILILQGGFC